MDNDAQKEEDVLARIKDLVAQLDECKEELRVLKKSRNNHVRKHEEDRISWAQERNHDRAKADELLQFEKGEHRRSEEELGKTREQLRDVSFKLLLAEETERKRIAQEIHDGIGQHWSIVKLRVERILSQLSQEIATPLGDILPIIQMGMEETRRVQMNLRPALLDDLGILATINWVFREFKKANPDIQITARINIQEDQIPDVVKTVVYRVMQEAMNNVIKHSRAGVVNLMLEEKDGKIEFVIQDNGQGFDLDSTLSYKDTDRGLGLAGMKERVQLSGGSFILESAKGAGTAIRAVWPCPAPH